MPDQNTVSFGANISRERQEKEFALREFHPAAAPKLAFRVMLPKAWKSLSGLQVSTPLRDMKPEAVEAKPANDNDKVKVKVKVKKKTK